MALINLWKASRDELLTKHVQQIIAVAGDGELADGNKASAEFRNFLCQIPSTLLTRYATDCLAKSFSSSGLALQDIVNEIGHRLGFECKAGRYRGVSGQPGHDGIWKAPNGHCLVVEVKTSDAFRIDLNDIAGYREALVRSEQLSIDQSSILIIVGRQDTGDLEAQIRGSRHAWDIRLISTEALIKLLAVKEDVDDPRIQARIHAVLQPREFTRLDEIIDVLFSTTEDIKQDDNVQPSSDDETVNIKHGPKFTPVAFHEACINRLERHLKAALVKRSRTTYFAPDKSLHLICAVSREHMRSNQASYWFAFHPHQHDFLKKCKKSYVALGCGSEERLLLIPFHDFEKWLTGMNETVTEDRSYRHIIVARNGEKFELALRHGVARADLTPYVLKSSLKAASKLED